MGEWDGVEEEWGRGEDVGGGGGGENTSYTFRSGAKFRTIQKL